MNEKLIALKQAANNICNMALAESKRIKEPINWADLRCVQSEKYETDDGTVGYRVYIEEAAPDSFNLQVYIGEKLREMGYSGIEVRTEW